MCITHYPSTPVPRVGNWWARLVRSFLAQRQARRAAARRRQAVHVLRGLGSATLRDIGLTDQLPPCRHSIARSDFLNGL